MTVHTVSTWWSSTIPTTSTCGPPRYLRCPLDAWHRL